MAFSLIEKGFSITTLGEDKRANFAWSKYQKEIISKDQFSKYFDYKGGIYKKDGFEIKPTTGVALICGFKDLEVIDVDCKVIKGGAKEIVEWKEEFFGFLKDNIENFNEKFVITATQNKGFHILYRNKNVTKNTKIATLKGCDQAILESRGRGGYVKVYDSFFYGKYYTDVKYISDEDREILWSCCKVYDYIKTEVVNHEKTESKKYESDLTPWDDYNNKNKVLDIVSSNFSVVRNLKDKIIVKRHGAESPHSGYIYKDNDLLYLFSTGTQYPHETALSAFACYAWRDFNGDFKEATKQAYQDGYGQRLKKEPPKELIIEVPKTKTEHFPIDVFPEPFANYILDCNRTLDSVIDYMGGAMLWSISVVIGNSLEIEVKKGWKEKAIVWISNVGKAGIGKTPSVKNIIFPLKKINHKMVKQYIEDSERYEEWNSLSKEEKKKVPEVKKPLKRQFIVNDITTESLINTAKQNPFVVAVHKDELAGWLKDMNKYREGSDKEFWLSSFSNESITVNRIGRPDDLVESPFIPVLGGIQPDILNSFFTAENKSNGFIDRLLLTYPDAEVESFNDKEMSDQALTWYDDVINNFYFLFNKKFCKMNDDGEIITETAVLSKDAKIVWKKTFNEYTEVQNGDFENEYLKSMYPKQKTYIPRFALLIHVLDCFSTNKDKEDYLVVSKEAMEKAVKLSKYFIAMAKKVKVKGKVSAFMIDSIKGTVKSDFEKVEQVYNKNPKFNRTELSEILGVSRRTIQNYVKKIEENESN